MNNMQDVKNYLSSISNFDDIKVYELTPKYDTRQSFYKKAIVKKVNNLTLLYSYNTLVCAVYDDCYGIRYFLNHDVNDNLLFSNTTLRHIKEFLYQNNISTPLKKIDIIANERVYF